MRKLTLAIVLACSVAATFSARAQTIPNTVVRFEVLTGGTNFGYLDFELFDQDKPETVRNFLLYVYSGAYSNLVLHRLVPNFVVQAGHIHIDDPTSTNVFASFLPWADFGKITNEYSVGPQLSNIYGTIAMARIGGQTNSASYEWFINLTNNTSLDTVDGGFTVFGRVVNSVGPNLGTNLLNYFNTVTNIRSYFVFAAGENLSALPVITNHVQSPLFNELFTVRASVIQGNTTPDAVAPTIQVTQPAGSSMITTNSRVTLAGTASDNQAVARVLYDTPSGRSFIASGKDNWSVEVPVNLGTNRFQVRSVDYFGNVSGTNEIIVIREDPPLDPSHTIVRFNVQTAGTNFGYIDIELFDQEKPETVRNFLLYVYTGAYSNLVLHQLGRNTNGLAVLQGGHVTLTNVTSMERFTSYVRGPDYGRITNEYGVGPELSNVYGTIAMARITGLTNSANTDFYFNLTNNSSLDTNEGGYTVFGRVVNTTTALSGTNLLNNFNARRLGNGAAFVFLPTFEGFELPVSINRTSSEVAYADLFTMNASVIHGGTSFARETIAPSVAVGEPASNPRTTDSTISFSGTASDDTAVARVYYDSPLGRFAARGDANWTAQVELRPGTNLISVRSVDFSGNLSPASTRTVFYSVPRPITLEIQGKGKVSGITDGQMLELGVTYKVVARPNPGLYFNGWRGDVFSNDRTYYFTMQDGVTNVIAVFTKTLLNLTKGTYSGVFFPSTSNGPPSSSGFLTLNLGGSGEYFGHLMPLGANYAIHGKLNATNGTSIITGSRGRDLLVLYLQLFPDAQVIAGSYSDGHFVSDFLLWLAPRFGPTNPAPAGNYSFFISPPQNPDAAAGKGYGSGTATIDSLGRIVMTGTLGDGTPIRQRTALLKGNQWPFIASAIAGREAALGWVAISSNNVLAADVRLFSRTFSGNTNQNAKLNGSLFTPPSQVRLLNWTNGLLTLSGDGLTQPITTGVVLNEDGSFTLSSNPNNIQLGFPDTKGAISGSFTHPVTQAVTPIRGAAVQSTNVVAGSFGSGTNSGIFLIRQP